jgi:hypothetical protein
MSDILFGVYNTVCSRQIWGCILKRGAACLPLWHAAAAGWRISVRMTSLVRTVGAVLL